MSVWNQFTNKFKPVFMHKFNNFQRFMEKSRMNLETGRIDGTKAFSDFKSGFIQ